MDMENTSINSLLPETRTIGSSGYLSVLPIELFTLVTASFTNKDIKSLRLVSKDCKASCQLSIDRVFISPNHKNLGVFLSIANHPEFRFSVHEIIWDDSKFERILDAASGIGTRIDQEAEEILADDENRYARTISGFREACEMNLYNPSHEKRYKLEGSLTPRRNLEIYRKLYQEQQEIIESGADAAAFQYGLSAFPSLRRVIVTSEVYRIYYGFPFYNTPLLRSFPKGFNYMLPWSWKGEEDQYFTGKTWRDVKHEYHGFNTVLAALTSKQEGHIPEFCVDSQLDWTGIWDQFFQEDSPEFNNFRTICERGLRRLDLAINFPNRRGQLSWTIDRRLRSVLAMSPNMEHFKLHTSRSGPTAILSNFIPIATWDSLKSLSLSFIHLDTDDFNQFLAQKPASLQEFEFIQVILVDTPWRRELEILRDELGWRNESPYVTIATEEDGGYRLAKMWIGDDIGAFFEGGENPFRCGEDDKGNIVKPDRGYYITDFLE